MGQARLILGCLNFMYWLQPLFQHMNYDILWFNIQVHNFICFLCFFNWLLWVVKANPYYANVFTRLKKPCSPMSQEQNLHNLKCRVNWPIIDRLPMTEHFGKSFSFFFHFLSDWKCYRSIFPSFTNHLWNEKSKWIAAYEREGGGKCLTMIGFELLLLVRCHSKTISKMPTK